MMQLDDRIRVLKPNEFRTHLTSNDVILNDVIAEAIFVEGGYLKDSDGYKIKDLSAEDRVLIEEEVYTFVGSPIVVPSMPYMFYGGKLRGIDSVKLYYAVRDFTFLNPLIGKGGLIKMSKHIHRHLVYWEHMETPSISLSDLTKEVIRIHYSLDLSNLDIVETNKVVLFKHHSLFDVECKKRISNLYRYSRHVALTLDLLYNGAIYAVENTPRLLKVSNPKVKESISMYVDDYNKKNKKQGLDLAPMSNTLKSDNTYYKYLARSPKTKKYLDLNNADRIFKTDLTYEKYLQFLDIDIDYTLDKFAKELEVSKSTIIIFKEIKNS